MKIAYPLILLKIASRRKEPRSLRAEDFLYPNIAQAFRWAGPRWGIALFADVPACERFLPMLETALAGLRATAEGEGRTLAWALDTYLAGDPDILNRLARPGCKGGLEQFCREVREAHRVWHDKPDESARRSLIAHLEQAKSAA